MPPCLKIDEDRLIELRLNGDKLKENSEGSGHFIYTVAANRDDERRFGFNDVAFVDKMGNINQNGERKRLPFRVKAPVSAGGRIAQGIYRNRQS